MSIKPSPNRAALAGQNGLVSQIWRDWFASIRNVLGFQPLPLKSYTVAGVPDASLYTGHIIYVSNETGGATLAFSDGTDWRRVQDRAVIS